MIIRDRTIIVAAQSVIGGDPVNGIARRNDPSDIRVYQTGFLGQQPKMVAVDRIISR